MAHYKLATGILHFLDAQYSMVLPMWCRQEPSRCQGSALGASHAPSPAALASSMLTSSSCSDVQSTCC